MANKTELLIEANRRGLLKGPKKEAFDQAVSRGLIKTSEAPVNENPNLGDIVTAPDFANKVGQSVSTAVGETAGNVVAGFTGSVVDAIQGLRQFGNAVTGDQEGAQQVLDQRNAAKEQAPEGAAATVGKIAGVAAPIIATLPLGAASVAGRLAAGTALGGGFAAAGSEATEQKDAAGNALKGAAIGVATAGAGEALAKGAKVLASKVSQKAAGEVARANPNKITETQNSAQRLTQEGLEAPRLTTAQSGGDKIAASVEHKLLSNSGKATGERAADIAREQGRFANNSIDFISKRVLKGQTMEKLKETENTLFRSIDDAPLDRLKVDEILKKSPTAQKLFNNLDEVPGIADEIASGALKKGTIGELRAVRSTLAGQSAAAGKTGDANLSRQLNNVVKRLDKEMDLITNGQLTQANALTTQRKIVETMQKSMSKVKPKLDGQYAPSQVFDALFAKGKDFDELIKRAPEMERQLKDVKIILRRIGLSNLDTAAANAIAGKPFGFGAIVDGAKKISANTVNDGLLEAALNPEFAKRMADLKRLPSRREVQKGFMEILSDLANRSTAATAASLSTNTSEEK